MVIKTDSLREKFVAAGQGQVFAYFDGLSEAEQEALFAEVESIDLNELEQLVDHLVMQGNREHVDYSKLSPAPYIALPEDGGDPAEWKEAKKVGEKALKAGRVAVFTVAGGQGTRLGFEAPKGTFPISPVRNASLFQIFAEKILAAQKHYKKAIPWFIQTSHVNHQATLDFFKQQRYFGLSEKSVTFFRQGRMPAVDFNGKIILEDKHRIAMSPDGHGGAMRALVKSGAIEKMEALGVDIISYFQVDNPLVRVVDPCFIGFHLKANSEMSSKMLLKSCPEEKLGHFCQLDGKDFVVEYSDMPEALKVEQDDATGKLRFIAGSIAIHVMDRDFVKRLGAQSAPSHLPFHRADKKIAHLDDDGERVKSKEINGVKFEQFIFDALPLAKKTVIIETERLDEFSPVKNGKGVDSAESCRNDMLRKYARWVKAVGGELETFSSGLPAVRFEISPLYADSEEAFKKRWAKQPKAICNGTVLI